MKSKQLGNEYSYGLLLSFAGWTFADLSPTPVPLVANKKGTQDMLAVMLFVRSN